MRIDNISVRGLFDRFDHDIELDPSERIAIIYGPNGFGKTMILRIVNAYSTLRFAAWGGCRLEKSALISTMVRGWTWCAIQRNPCLKSLSPTQRKIK